MWLSSVVLVLFAEVAHSAPAPLPPETPQDTSRPSVSVPPAVKTAQPNPVELAEVGLAAWAKMASESDRHAARIDFALMTHSTVPLTQLTRVGARQDFVPVISVDDGSTSSVAYSFSREQFTTFLQPLDELELENQLQNTTVHAMEAEQPWGVIADVFRVVDVR